MLLKQQYVMYFLYVGITALQIIENEPPTGSKGIFSTIGNLKDQIVKDQSYACFVGIGLHLCVYECLKRPRCTSVVYTNSMLRCSLLAVSSKTATFKKAQHSVFTDIKGWQQTDMTKCRDTCTGGKCLITKQNKVICNKIEEVFYMDKPDGLRIEGRITSLQVSTLHPGFIYVTKQKERSIFAIDVKKRSTVLITITNTKIVPSLASAVIKNTSILIWLKNAYTLMKIEEPKSLKRGKLVKAETMAIKLPQNAELTGLVFFNGILGAGDANNPGALYGIYLRNRYAYIENIMAPFGSFPFEKAFSKFTYFVLIAIYNYLYIFSDIHKYSSRIVQTEGISFIDESIFELSVDDAKVYLLSKVKDPQLYQHYRICISSKFSSGKVVACDLKINPEVSTVNITAVCASVKHPDYMYFIRNDSTEVQFIQFTGGKHGRFLSSNGHCITISLGWCQNGNTTCVYILRSDSLTAMRANLYMMQEPRELKSVSEEDSILIKLRMEFFSTLMATPFGKIVLIHGSLVNKRVQIYSAINSSSEIHLEVESQLNLRVPLEGSLSGSFSPDGSEILVSSGRNTAYYKVHGEDIVEAVRQEPVFLRR